MRHHLKIVASNFRLNENELTAFALENPRKYGIDNDNGFVTTSTSFTKSLVDDFKKELKFIIIDSSEKDRTYLIKANPSDFDVDFSHEKKFALAFASSLEAHRLIDRLGFLPFANKLEVEDI
jgi:hypothetical protein